MKEDLNEPVPVFSVLVTGGRDYQDKATLGAALEAIKQKRTEEIVIWSGAATSADYLSITWAMANGVDFRGYPAKLEDHGKSAGFIRNSRMISMKPDLVVAFPGGDETENCVEEARKANIPVWRVPEQWRPK